MFITEGYVQMNLKERAEKLIQLGFFEGASAPYSAEELSSKAESDGHIDPQEGPASALLLAGERLLEIPANAAGAIEDYGDLLESIEDFCLQTFQLGEIRAEFVEVERDVQEIPGAAVRLRFRLDDHLYETTLMHDPELIDLAFLNEIENHLETIGEPRRLCPIVELMDDTARYVFVEPSIMEEAEITEVISAPDFEE